LKKSVQLGHPLAEAIERKKRACGIMGNYIPLALLFLGGIADGHAAAYMISTSLEMPQSL